MFWIHKLCTSVLYAKTMRYWWPLVCYGYHHNGSYNLYVTFLILLNKCYRRILVTPDFLCSFHVYDFTYIIYYCHVNGIYIFQVYRTCHIYYTSVSHTNWRSRINIKIGSEYKLSSHYCMVVMFFQLSNKLKHILELRNCN